MSFHVTCAAYLEDILLHGLEPRIGSRSAALGETVAAVYLFPTREAVEDGLSGWLGEQFDQDDELVILEVDVPDTSDGFYEMALRERIPAAAISAVFDESFALRTGVTPSR